MASNNLVTETSVTETCTENTKLTSDAVETKEIVNKLSKYRLSQDFHKQGNAEKIQVPLSVRKPERGEYIRVFPDNDDPYSVITLEFKEGNNTTLYLVSPEIAVQIEDEVRTSRLQLTTTRYEAYYIWPLKISKGRSNSWNDSAYAAAQEAMESWVRVKSMLDIGVYEPWRATAEIPEPTWPEKSMDELVDEAFGENKIDSMDHIVLKKLRGEI